MNESINVCHINTTLFSASRCANPNTMRVL